MASSARIDELRKKFDENPRRYFAPLANEYRKAGDLEQAIFICQEYLPQQPGHMSGHIVYGQALYELNRHEEARTVFETALSLDPENLIALRHLGDIARLAGDATTARMWYQRVLEADPRNEEIAQLMLSLLSSEPAPAVDHTAPTPLSTPSVAAATPAASHAPADTGFHVEKSEDTTLEAAPSRPALPPPPAPPPETGHISRHAPKEEELLDLDSFDLGGVPLSSLRSSKPVRVQPGDESVVEAASPDSSGMFDLPESIETATTATTPIPEAPAASEPEEPFEADPFAMAAATEPEIEQATDVVLGLPDDSPAPAASAAEDEAVDGFETFEAGIIPTAPAASGSLEMDSFFERPATAETTVMSDEPLALETAGQSAAVESVESVESAEPAAEKSEAFVTETMATLYLQQGHLDAALDIYRKLVEQRPDDAALGERLRAVEEHVHGKPVVAETATDIDEPLAPPARAYGGPTIREFLSGIVSRKASPQAAEAAPPEPLAPPTAAVEPENDDDDEDEEVLIDLRPPRPSGETVSGSLGVLFSGADAAASDTAAAQTLADAFAPEGPETAPLQGMPAHRASSELSLNHVFKGSTPPRANAGSDDFSFDQFFAENAGDDATPATDTPAAGTPEATDDIAQFNAWLNGLKKT